MSDVQDQITAHLNVIHALERVTTQDCAVNYSISHVAACLAYLIEAKGNHATGAYLQQLTDAVLDAAAESDIREGRALRLPSSPQTARKDAP